MPRFFAASAKGTSFRIGEAGIRVPLFDISGIIFYFAERNLMGDGGIISAIVQGAFSGWAATGINQIVKQSNKKFSFKYNDETIEELSDNKGDE